ncbi:MAG: hypothetical protein RLZZ168_1589 [Cyanobacteriota bacterium]|jgi:hypothetical protein
MLASSSTTRIVSLAAEPGDVEVAVEAVIAPLWIDGLSRSTY